MDSDVIVVTNDKGEQQEYTILFTFENDGKSYVLYYDDQVEDPEVFASIYDDEGHLFDVESAEEWSMISDVFDSFMSQNDDSEEDCDCHHQNGECGCKHHHEGEKHECNCQHDGNAHHHEGQCGCHHHDEDHECGCKHHH